jgi:hypothetical protein
MLGAFRILPPGIGTGSAAAPRPRLKDGGVEAGGWRSSRRVVDPRLAPADGPTTGTAGKPADATG